MRDLEAAPIVARLIGEHELADKLREGKLSDEALGVLIGGCLFCKCSLGGAVILCIGAGAASLEIAEAAEGLVTALAWFGTPLELETVEWIITFISAMVFEEALEFVCEQIEMC